MRIEIFLKKIAFPKNTVVSKLELSIKLLKNRENHTYFIITCEGPSVPPINLLKKVSKIHILIGFLSISHAKSRQLSKNTILMRELAKFTNVFYSKQDFELRRLYFGSTVGLTEEVMVQNESNS